MSSINYRKDIDGLRAIAILSVVGYHAMPEKFQGGFLGVDIFFVISGFLISTILYKEMESNSFSYINFYKRRIQRIFPALLLVLSANFLFGWFVLFPDEFRQLGKHISGGIAFVSNFVLLGEAGYFDNSSDTKPLLQLWSLGIEEQFYIFWPIIVLIAWKTKFNFLVLALIIAYISFILNQIPTSIEAQFYHPIYRIWELMLGGILAYISIHKKNLLPEKKQYINALSLFGLLLIIIANVFVNNYTFFSGAWTLLPTLGAFFIIASKKSLFNQYILANPILVYIGLISYPLYLWHWSIFSFAHIVGYSNDNNIYYLIILSFLLALLTYELLEKNLKKVKNNTLIYTLIFISFVLLFTGLCTMFELFPSRNNTHIVNVIEAAHNDWDYPTGLKYTTLNNETIYIKKGSKEKVLFFGDSHIEQYAPRIKYLINKDPVQTKTAIFATRGGCPPIPNVYEDLHPKCSKNFRDIIINYALSPDIDSVVIGASWKIIFKPHVIAENRLQSDKNKYKYYYLHNNKKYYNNDAVNFAWKALEELILSIAKHKKVFLIIDNPSGKEFSPDTFISGSRITGIKTKKTKVQEYSDITMRKKLFNIAKHNNVVIIDPAKHFCKNGKCQISMDNGIPIYKDTSHIRPFYIKNYADYIDLTVKQ